MSPLNTDVVYIRLSSVLSTLEYQLVLQLSDRLNVWVANGMMHKPESYIQGCRRSSTRRTAG